MTTLSNKIYKYKFQLFPNLRNRRQSFSSRFFHFDQLVHTVNHKLHQLYLWVTKPVFVGDVIDGARRVWMLSIKTTDLQVVFFCPFFETVSAAGSALLPANLFRG